MRVRQESTPTKVDAKMRVALKKKKKEKVKSPEVAHSHAGPSTSRVTERAQRARRIAKQYLKAELEKVSDKKKIMFQKEKERVGKRAFKAIRKSLREEYAKKRADPKKDYPGGFGRQGKKAPGSRKHNSRLDNLREGASKVCLAYGLHPLPVFDLTGKNDCNIPERTWVARNVLSYDMTQLIMSDQSTSRVKCGTSKCYKRYSQLRTVTLKDGKAIPLARNNFFEESSGEGPLTEDERNISILPCGQACGCDPNTCDQHYSHVQRSVPLCVFRHKTLGWSVRAVDAIKRFTIISFFAGELMTSEEFAEIPGKEKPMQGMSLKRSHFVADRKRVGTQISDTPPSQIHAQEVGNEISLINHNCEPNCLTGGALRERTGFWDVVVIARRDIKAGEELTIHYFGESIPKWEDWPFECLCGNDSCDYTTQKRQAR